MQERHLSLRHRLERPPLHPGRLSQILQLARLLPGKTYTNFAKYCSSHGSGQFWILLVNFPRFCGSCGFW